MNEYALVTNKSFSKRIELSDWKQHLDSHHSLIIEFKKFLESFNLSLFVDKFIAILRFRCFELADSKSIIEELQVDFQAPEYFVIKIVIKHSQEVIFKEYKLTIADILGWEISSEPLLNTERIEIGILLPSEEPEIIDFLKDPDVWKMRGETYRPLANVHYNYKIHNSKCPWYKYHFVLRLRQNKKPIGFISFYQISKPNLVTPLINQTPYKPVMLSYGLAKSYWGKGLMSESLSACAPWFIENQSIEELVGFVAVNNQGSRRLLQKLGLQECGMLNYPNKNTDLKDISNFVIYKH